MGFKSSPLQNKDTADSPGDVAMLATIGNSAACRRCEVNWWHALSDSCRKFESHYNRPVTEDDFYIRYKTTPYVLKSSEKLPLSSLIQ